MISSREDGFDGRTANGRRAQAPAKQPHHAPVEPPRQARVIVHVENPHHRPRYALLGGPTSRRDQSRAPAGVEGRIGPDRPGGEAAAAGDLRVEPAQRRGSSAAIAPSRTSSAAMAHSEPRVAPSSIFSATPRPRSGRIATKTASRAGLDRDRALHRRHQLRAGAALAGDQQRMRQHRRDQPARRRLADRAEAARVGHPRHRQREAVDRGGEIRRRAAVDAPAGALGAAHLLEGGAHRPLHRMVDLDVLRAAAEPAVQRQEPRVLARAVVVELAGQRRLGAQPRPLRRVVGHLRPAAQVGLAEPEVGQPARHPARRASPRPGARRRPAPAARRRGRRRRRSRPAAAPAASCRTTAAGSPPRGRPRPRRCRPVASQTTAWPRWRDSATVPRQTSTIGTADQSSPHPLRQILAQYRMRWRKASRIRDLTVPSGRPSRAAIWPWLSPS